MSAPKTSKKKKTNDKKDLAARGKHKKTSVATDRRASSNKKNKVLGVLGSIFWPLMIFFVAQFLIAITLVPFIPGLSDESQSVSIVDTFIYSTAFELMALALVGLYLRFKEKDLKWLGLGKLSLKQLKPIIPAASVYAVATIASFIVINMLVPTVNLDQDQVVGFEGAKATPEILLAFVALVIITPVTEEVIMRGLMFRGLNRILGFTAAAIISAGVFALLHGQLNVGIDTFILGLVLAWLVNKTNSLWPAIFLHMLKNMVAFTFLYLIG